MTDISAAVLEAVERLTEIEDAIAAHAWLLTEPSRRDRLEWHVGQRVASDGGRMFPRSIACRLT